MDDELNKQLKQQIYQEPVIYSWEYTGFLSGEKPMIILIQMPLITILAVGLLAGNGFLSIILASIGGAVFALNKYNFYDTDSVYQYHLTKIGIYYTHENVSHEVADKPVRGIPWFGIIAFITALLVAGPYAFIGIVGYAFTSSTLTKKSKDEPKVILFTDESFLINLISDNRIFLQSLPHSEKIINTLSCHKKDKYEIIRNLNKTVPNCKLLYTYKTMGIWMHNVLGDPFPAIENINNQS